MRDFSKPYRNKVYFGHWVDEYADKRGAEAALKILEQAVRITYEEDARGQDVTDAIEYLGRSAIKDRPYRDFVKALEVSDPKERYFAAQSALQRIRRDHISE